MRNRLRIIKDTNGDAVVEAAILFPVILMIFAALSLLALYLPTRAALQRATQYAATAIATECSDAWLRYSDDSAYYFWEYDKKKLTNVYVALFSGYGDVQTRSENIVNAIEGRSISSKAGVLSVDGYIDNKIIYKEVVVSATRKFKTPVKLGFIGFPEEIPITVTSTAVVQNGDEFVRNMDLAVDFVKFISKKFGLDDLAGSISSFGGRIVSLLGL